MMKGFFLSKLIQKIIIAHISKPAVTYSSEMQQR